MKKNLYLKGKKLFALAGLVIFVCTLTDQNNILYGWNEFLIDKSFVYIPAAGNQLFPSIVFANSCYFIVWEDWRNGISDIYGARISLAGTILDSIGIPISTAPRYQSAPDVIFDGNVYFVVWRDNRITGTSMIYGARIKQNGVVFDTAGIPVSQTYCSSPAVAFDGTNYFVVWADERDGYNYCDIYGARVTRGGIVLDPGGIPISIAASRQDSPDISFDGTNLFVVWGDRRSGESDIYCSRVTSDGIVLDPAGIPVSTAYGTQNFPSITFNGSIYLVVWTDSRNGMQDIYGARINPSGTVLDTAGIPISVAVGNQSQPTVCFDGENFLVSWEDGRGGTHDIYGARVSPGGIVLDTMGIPIASAANGQYRPAVAFDTANYLIVWEDFRNSTISNDIYGARITTGGNVIDTTGIPISTQIHFWSQYLPAVHFNGTDYLIVWENEQNNLDYDIYGARLNRSGIVLDTIPFPISTAPNFQSEPAITFDGTNYFVVWSDCRNENYSADIYGARITSAGIVLDTAGIPISVCNDDQCQPVVAFGGTNYLVVWADKRNGRDYDIYGARVNTQGILLDTIIIVNAHGYQWCPAITFSGTNYFVVWEDYRNNRAEIYGTRINQEGVVIDTNGIFISMSSNYCCNPTVAFDDNNYLVAWEESRSGTYWDILGCRINQSGQVIDSTVIVISNAPNSQWYPALTFNGINYNIVWQDSRNSPWDIYGATVSREGIVIGSFNVSIQSGKQIYPAITSGGDSVLVVYSGWCDSILGFPANTMRIWGKFLVPTVVIENRNLHYKTVGHKVLIYPNPFTNHCVIKFQSATQFGGPNHQTNPKLATCYSATQYGGLLATLNIYDVSGRVVKSFNPASSIQNQESIIWDGRDDFGRRVPAGVYFLVYQMGTSKASVKVVKLR